MSKMSRSMLDAMDRFVLEMLANAQSGNGARRPDDRPRTPAAQYATAGAQYN
jgi:hypothetical protein